MASIMMAMAETAKTFIHYNDQYMIHLILFGPPGAGKGTQAITLVEEFKFKHLSTGDLLRAEIADKTALGLEAKKFIDAGELVPDATVIGMIKSLLERLESVKGIIYDGFPRTVAQAEALDKMLASRQESISGLLSLEVPHDELVKRLLIRGESSGRTDDADISTIENRISVYSEKTQPLIDFYTKQGKYHPIEGIGSIEDISGRLISAVKTL